MPKLPLEVSLLMMTFGELFQRYYERHVLTRTRCPENAKYFFTAHGERWKDVPLSDIKREHIQDWCDELGVKSKSSATRAVNMMSATINWGIRRGLCSIENPCRGVEKFQVRSRERFLLPDEFERFKAALEGESPILRDFFWMCLLTGARRGRVQAMQWEEIDTTLAMWRIPKDKNGDSQHIPLSPAALAILQRRKSESRSSWVFPSERSDGHLVEPKRAWKRITKRANISDLRIHDLRRTVGSYMAIRGESPYVIGRALGHKDQRSTAVYARLNLEPIRKAFEQIQAEWGI